MSIQTELTRIINAKAAIKTAIEGKGVTVSDSAKLDAFATLIESIEADGAGEMFYAEITPATSGEVLTFEVGEIGERIAGVIVSLKIDASIEINKNYAVQYIAAVNQKRVSSRPSVVNILAYQNGWSQGLSKDSSVQYRSSTPNGEYIYQLYYIWNSTSEKPWVKFYVTNGAESKYGLLVGKTYDIWVIKD